ncbi:MAG: hypothetical protein KatS3mg009_3034 [Acidimicrobiia bacterium]|nr:MAG: hypothetical protein KatS3mg009_3034 [Acidimicrobiia bacterium]
MLVEDSTLDGGAELVAHRILAALREPFVLRLAGGKEVRVTASIGIAHGLRDNPNDLLRDADVALYEAKAAGKDRYVVFEPAMQAVAQQRRSLEFDVRIALEREQYALVYQPIFDLRTGAVTGLEALLRWHHPERGVVDPEHYIPILERNGQIVDVGRWVLREACRQMQTWHAQGYPLDVSVNVSRGAARLGVVRPRRARRAGRHGARPDHGSCSRSPRRPSCATWPRRAPACRR